MKNYADILGFEPTVYQSKIFNFVENGYGNCVIKARAGSGKTKTLISCMRLIPKQERVLFIAFNKSIVEEIQSKCADNTNCRVKTIHSLGYSIIKENYDGEIRVDEHKYSNIIKELVVNDEELVKDVDDKLMENYMSNIKQLCLLARLNMCQSVKEIKRLSNTYGIKLLYNEADFVVKVLDKGKSDLQVIDYTDMVWLPYELGFYTKKNRYDWIFWDECQDAAEIFLKLFFKCFKRGGRYVCCGDYNQMINLFAGASPQAFNYLCNYANTTTFSLPISFRCDRNIIRFAQKYVEDIYPRDNAGEGVVDKNSSLSKVEKDDMIICRNVAPLVRCYAKLLDMGKKCYIKGVDISSDIIEVLNRCENEYIYPDLSNIGVLSELYGILLDKSRALINEHHFTNDDILEDESLNNFYNLIGVVEALGYIYETKTEILNKLSTIFKDEGDGVCLSTIHKSKGLEADNVFILCYDTMEEIVHLKNQQKTKGWEYIQEYNLVYVGITRAKHYLGLVSENEIPPMFQLRTTNIVSERKKSKLFKLGVNVNLPDFNEVIVEEEKEEIPVLSLQDVKKVRKSFSFDD